MLQQECGLAAATKTAPFIIHGRCAHVYWRAYTCSVHWRGASEPEITIRLAEAHRAPHDVITRSDTDSDYQENTQDRSGIIIASLIRLNVGKARMHKMSKVLLQSRMTKIMQHNNSTIQETG